MADGITFDKASYLKGEKVTATFTLAARVNNVIATGDAGVLGKVTGTFKITAALTVSDTGAHVWTVVSDDGTTLVATTLA